LCPVFEKIPIAELYRETEPHQYKSTYAETVWNAYAALNRNQTKDR
jgi:hypothetical protein